MELVQRAAPSGFQVRLPGLDRNPALVLKPWVYDAVSHPDPLYQCSYNTTYRDDRAWLAVQDRSG